MSKEGGHTLVYRVVPRTTPITCRVLSISALCQYYICLSVCLTTPVTCRVRSISASSPLTL